MAQRGNRIILTPDRGYKVEGIIAAGETPLPGTIMMYDPSVTHVSGRQTFKIYNRDADGDRPSGPFVVLCEDILQGKTVADAYVAGTRCFGFVPNAGCELNLLLKDADTGTSTNDVAANTLLIVVDGTGLLKATTGSPETEVALTMEDTNDFSGSALAWCIWTGK